MPSSKSRIGMSPREVTSAQAVREALLLLQVRIQHSLGSCSPFILLPLRRVDLLFPGVMVWGPWTARGPLHGSHQACTPTNHHVSSCTSHHTTPLPHTRTVLYHTVLYCTIPHGGVVCHSAVPYCTVLYHISTRTTLEPYCTIPYCTVPYRTISYHTVAHHTTPYPISRHSTV